MRIEKPQTLPLAPATKLYIYQHKTKLEIWSKFVTILRYFDRVFDARSNNSEYSSSSQSTLMTTFSLIKVPFFAKSDQFTCKTLNGSKSSTGKVIRVKSLPIVCFKMDQMDKLKTFILTGRTVRYSNALTCGTATVDASTSTSDTWTEGAETRKKLISIKKHPWKNLS